MTNRKAQNSILFLTTLSVYLGLVLVGGSPVFAHAALTQRFELVNELETDDDLDKKPGDGQAVGDLAAVCEELALLAGHIADRHPQVLIKDAFALDRSLLAFPIETHRPDSVSNGPAIRRDISDSLQTSFDTEAFLSGGDLQSPGWKYWPDAPVGIGAFEASDAHRTFFGAETTRRVVHRDPLEQGLSDRAAGPQPGIIVVIAALPRASLDDQNS
jgi:hypothetical protein